MNVKWLKFSDQKIIIILLSLIFLNYFGIFFSYNYFFKLFFSYIIIGSFLICLFTINKKNFEIKLLLIVLLILSLGSPSFHYDARWIWLFKGKQFFINNNLEFLKEEYLINSIWQSYPLLGPSLAASIANFFGYWNEIFPKVFNIILATPGLIYLASIFEKKLNKLLFIFLTLFILEKSIIIGEMDGLLSIYFTVTFLVIYKIFFNNNIFLNNKDNFLFSKNKKFNIFFLILSLMCMTLLKKESLVLISIIIFSLFLCKYFFKDNKIDYKNFVFLIISLLPLVFWEIYLIKNEILVSNHGSISNLFNEDFKLFSKLFDFKSILLINSKIFLNKGFFIAFLFMSFVFGFLYSLLKKIKNDKKIKGFILYFMIIFISYIGFYNFIYLITSYDLVWHLKVSAGRIALPISFLTSIVALVLIEKYFTKT